MQPVASGDRERVLGVCGAGGEQPGAGFGGFGVELAGGLAAGVTRSNLAGRANYGYCASHSRWFWGLRLYLITIPAGMPITWALADPKLDERDVLAAMLEVEPELATACPGPLLITDKGFRARWFETSLEGQGIELLRPAMRNEQPVSRCHSQAATSAA